MNLKRSVLRPLAAAMLCTALLVPTSDTLQAQGSASSMVSQVNLYLDGLAQSHAFSGTVLLARNGTILLDEGYGFADSTLHAPNGPNTEFRISELGMQFYVVALLQLMHAGKLGLQDSLCRFLPSCPAAWQSITIQDVLTGSTGIYDYLHNSANSTVLARPITLARLIALLEKYPHLDTPPGAQCEDSSNASLPLLVYLVTRLSGETAVRYLQQHLLVPLGLHHTGPDHTTITAPARALGYASWGDPAVDPQDMSALPGALYSTVGDLYRLEQAFVAGSVLSTSLGAALTPACNYCPPNCYPGQSAGGSGYGWDIGVKNLHPYWAQGSSVPGFITTEIHYPGPHMSLILLSNMDSPGWNNVESTLQNMILS